MTIITRSVSTGASFALMLLKASFCGAFVFLSERARIQKHVTLNSQRREESFDLDVLQNRLIEMRRNIMEEEIQMPPNPRLSAHEFVAQVLRGLYDHDEPLPDSGFRMFLRSSSVSWKNKLYASVGAPRGCSEDAVASALGQAMARTNNQYGILVGEGEQYSISFPSDPLDYGDGTCWLECRLRNKDTDSLLAILGWQLERRELDGAWLVDRIDWQDFRDEFRPGVGREEWMRICG